MFKTPKALNETVKRRLGGDSPQLAMTPRRLGWGADFVRLPKASATDAFGKSGTALHDLLERMDTDHPDLERCLEEKIFSNHSLSVFVSIVGLAELAVADERQDLLPPLQRLELLPELVGSTNFTKSFVRCLKDKNQQRELRQSKKSQVIDMTTISRKGEELWNTQPSSFESLIRYEDAYAEEITAAKRRAARFMGLGCSAMHAQIMATVDMFQSQVADSYFGFNRLTFNAACVILAKWHDYQLIPPCILADFPPERNYKVNVDSSRFESFNFFSRSDDKDLSWPYSPRVYPATELALTPDVKEIIELCENYQGYNGKPLFDHYAVMVPGIDYPPLRDGMYSICTESGVTVPYEDQNEARFALDKMLLAADAFSAVVLGERDGKCYCLSVWS